MRGYFFKWLTLIVLFFATNMASADDIKGQKPVLLIGDSFQFIKGAWASYQVVDQAKGEQYRMWIATLDKKDRGKKPSSWMEVEVEMPGHPVVVTRFLVRETKQGPGDLLDVIVQMKGYSPFKVPEKYYKGEKNKEVGKFEVAQTVTRLAERTMSLRGRELTVVDVEALDRQGGTLKATVSESVPPIGLVAADANGVKMQLDDWGMAATSHIEGTPINFYLWLMKQIGMEVFK